MTHQKTSVVTQLMCGTALLICTTTGTLAQDVVSLDPIEVRRADPLGDAADQASSVYVSEAELDRAAMGDLKDLFAGIASVSVGGAIPVAQKIFVNGVDMLNLAVTVDGVSQNNRVFHHVSANAFDPGLMKTVRVDPGVAAADAGPHAVAGSVVMETIDVADFLEDGDNFGGQARLSFSDNGDTLSAAVTAATRIDGFELLAYAKRAVGGNYEDGDGNEVTGTEADLTSALIKAAYESDAGHRLEFSAQNMSDTADRNFRANFGGNGSFVEYDTSRSIVSLQYENTNGGGVWDPTASIGYSENEINAPLYEDSQGESYSLNATVENTFHLSSRDTITAGIDFLDQTSQYTNGDDGFTSQESRKNVGVFAQARLEPLDRLKLSLGARADWQDFTGSDYDGVTYTDDPFGLSGNASVVYEIVPGLSVRAAYSSVFGGIQLEDNYNLWDRVAYSSEYDYAALSASRSENYVLGLDWESGDWTLGGEIFKTKINDARSGDELFNFESQGLNLSSTYDWQSGFARLTYTHSDATIDNTDVSSYELLDFGALLGDVLAIEVQQELPNANALIGGNLDVAFDYNPAGSDAIDGYAVFNVFAEYTPPSFSDMTIRGEINNVFDADYSDRATYGGDFDGFETLNEPGRTVSVIATIDF